MTKKHFIALADWIVANNEREGGRYCEMFTERQISELGAFCKRQNPLFKRDRWLSYVAGECGKNGGKVK